MGATISTRWFWADWQSDPGVMACSYAARGLWHEMLGIAAANKREPGFVSLNGRKLETDELAQMTRGTKTEVDRLIAELDRNGVFSRDRRGIIYCRRMVRAFKNSINGRIGGEITQRNKRDNREIKGRNGRLGTSDNVLKMKRNRNSLQGKRKRPILQCYSSTESVNTDSVRFWPDDFRDQFWNRYPRKIAKKSAMTTLDSIRRDGKVTWQALLAGLDRYVAAVAANGTEEKYIKHPTTWLNGECWNDEHKPSNGGNHAKARRAGNGNTEEVDYLTFGTLSARLGASPARPD